MVHTKYPKEDCEQRPVLIPEVVSTDSWLNLSQTKHPKTALQSFDCEQRPVLMPSCEVVQCLNLSLTKHPKMALKSFDYEQRPVLMPSSEVL